MKFLHTADWQIGMKAAHVGAAAERVRAERVEAARRVVKVATNSDAEFILVAGDTFEDNGVDRVLVQKIADILGEFHGPVYLIPGNHDPLVPGSVWDHPSWASQGNLHVLKQTEPLEVPGGIIYPCPAREKHSGLNPVQWIAARAIKETAIGLAHGTVEGVQADEPEYPIPRDAPSHTGLDYIALGHWHSTATYSDAAGAVRMAYAGTHEPTKFGERDSGNALLVEIGARGQPPVVRPMRTGGLTWKVVQADLHQKGDLERVRVRIETMDNPASTLLDVRIRGILAADEVHELRRIREILESRFQFGRVDDSLAVPAPADDSWLAGLPTGALRDTAVRLRELGDASFPGQRPEGASPAVAAQALLELYALVAEVSK